MALIDAVILAGGRSPWLKEACGTEFRCLAPLGGRRMVDYIIDALQQSGSIGRIVVAASPGALAQLEGTLPEGVGLCAAKGDLPATAYAAARYFGDAGSEKMLGVCDDIPLVTGAGIRDFLEQCAAYPSGQLYYPIIPKEACQKLFPGAKRTYGSLRDGIFTGGNMMLVAKDVIPRGQQKAKEIFALRKSPLGLANWLGWSFVLKALFRMLSVAAAEKRFYTIMEIDSKAIITEHAGIGMDVDKPADLLLAEKYLQR